MIILIRGAGFTNKGSALMLCAILEKLRTRMPEAVIAMEPTGTETPVRLKRLDILPLGYFGRVSGYLPQAVRRSLKILTYRDVDIILDTSGFAYSDELGSSYTEKTASSIVRWKKCGIRIILLPQAFGPFLSPAIKTAFAAIAENSELIFVRDNESMAHITSLALKKINLKKAPDFTNLIEGIIDERYSDKKKRICIIPNYQMIKKTEKQDGIKYTSLLGKLIKYLFENGENPFFLIHGGRKDFLLSKEISREIKNSEIVQEENPLIIKGIIGCCKAVISSRYHGIISGLSQGVPTFGTKWSHKYNALFNEYDFPEGLFSVNLDERQIKKLACFICRENELEDARRRIMRASLAQKKLAEEMWNEVFKIINKQSP
ncbi:MAG TPA: polysaccharide pyruvyl transferase family protein [bacterium]|nr:polysaccharide pyruvyl transferase family protein [bacterium]